MIDRDDTKQELRLLPQRLLRYDSKQEKVLDGGLFTFVQGTDPEVLLLLEARPGRSGYEWQYALARMNSVILSWLSKPMKCGARRPRRGMSY